MYIKVEDIVNDVIIEEGKTSENDFLRYFKLALNGLKELHFDVGGGIRTVELTISSDTLTIDLPSDYVKYTKIGVYGNDGDVHPLGLRNDKSLVSTAANSTTVSDDELHPTYFEYVQEFGLGGGNNTNGYYRVDTENNTIQFTSDLSGKKIILEYISNSLIHPKEGKVVIHESSAEALRSYIYWKSIQRKRNINPNDKIAARNEYYNNKRLARARMLSFTKQEALQTTRKAFKQSPKM
tara:strand:- start:1387 stop:2100 length:714 start_codon:yes stop_codon:yes gene_type:complete